MSYYDSSRAQAYKQEMAQKRKKSASTGSGYVPTYGPNALYTSAGNTAPSKTTGTTGLGSTAPTGGGTGGQTAGAGGFSLYQDSRDRIKGSGTGSRIISSTFQTEANTPKTPVGTLMQTPAATSAVSSVPDNMKVGSGLQTLRSLAGGSVGRASAGTGAGGTQRATGVDSQVSATSPHAVKPAGGGNSTTVLPNGMSVLGVQGTYLSPQFTLNEETQKKLNQAQQKGVPYAQQNGGTNVPSSSEVSKQPIYTQYQTAKKDLDAVTDAILSKYDTYETYKRAQEANESLSDQLQKEKALAELREVIPYYIRDKDRYESFFTKDNGSALIESLREVMSGTAEELERKRRQLAGVQRGGGGRALVSSLQEEITALEKQYADYASLHTELATSYYYRENEGQREALKNDEHMSALYHYARTTESDIARLDHVTAYQKDPAGTDSRQARKDLIYLQEKYGLGKTVLADALYEKLVDAVTQAETALARGGYDYDRMAGYDKMLEDKAAAEERIAQWQAQAEEKPGWSTVGTLFAAPVRGVEYVTTMLGGIGSSDPGDYRNYVPMNTYNMHATNYVDAVRGTVTDNIESKLGKFLYQTGVSAADSMVMLGVSALTGIPQIATVSMGMSAASGQAKDIIERGGTNAQAFWGGLAAGAAEYVCEKIPLENLLKVKSANDVKGLLVNVFKQQAIEGGEEAVTEIANIISDAVVMGDKSRFNTRVKAYMADGMSETEAKQKATLDGIGDVALAGTGGFVAGGITGGIVNTGKYVQSQMQQGGSRGGGTNFASAGGRDANVPARGGMEAVTSDHGGSIQQSGNAQTQTMGNAGTSIGMNVPQTQQGGAKGKTSGNVDAPTAIVGKGGAQTSVLAETQAQTDVQMQAQSQADTQTGKTVKAEGKVTELLQEAMAQPADSPARQLAETLLSQQETALMEQGLELGSQYQLSHTEQAELAAETASNAISDQAVGELSRLMEQEHLTGSVKHGNVGLPVNVKLENAEVRRLYVEEVSKIHESIDPTLPLEERARLAFEARNRLRTGARDIMADEAKRAILDKRSPNKGFEELLISKMERKGLTREEALEDIYQTAVTTNHNVNAQFGIGGN